jgi:hypothetical protein
MGAPVPDARVERPILPQVATHLFWICDVLAVHRSLQPRPTRRGFFIVGGCGESPD